MAVACHLFKSYVMSALVLTFSRSFIYFLIYEILRQSDNISDQSYHSFGKV